MTTTAPEGWGGAEYGAGAYGIGAPILQLLEAYAVRENVVRLKFNVAPYFSGILNPNDASSRKRYQITTVGARAVRPVVITQAGGAGTLLDVTTDRPFSGYPAGYRIAVNNLVAAVSGNLLDSAKASFQFFGLARHIAPKLRDTVVPSRDIANRYDPIQSAELGSAVIPVDDTSDYAFDEGVISLRKRLHRRIVTVKGRFAHLPEYGLGVPGLLKKLNRQRVRAELKADAEIQFQQEPEVERAVVNITTEPNQPSIMRFRVSIQAPKLSADPINTDFLFNLNAAGQ